MAKLSETNPGRLSPLEALGNLTRKRLSEALADCQTVAISAYGEIKTRPVSQKRFAFYRHLILLQPRLVQFLAESYRGYLKVALANPDQSGDEPEQCAWIRIRPFVLKVKEWIGDWYVLACEGENRNFRRVASSSPVPGQTISFEIPPAQPLPGQPMVWRAPAWLFSVGPPVGIALMKSKHIPATDSEKKLGAAHTRLLLKGARRVFLGALAVAIENVWNEEIAATGAIPTVPRFEELRPKAAYLSTARPAKTRKTRRTHDKLRMRRDQTIAEIDDVSETITEFLRLMDERGIKPQPTWSEWPGSWKEAYKNPHLRELIHKDKSRALMRTKRQK